MKKLERRVIIVTRETRLKQVLESQNTLSQAKFYVNQLGGDFDEYEAEHRTYSTSVQRARQDVETLAGVQVLDRRYLPNFIFAPGDIVVVIGQDGLVANTLKYLDGQPLIGVNPDPSRWDGVLLPFTPENAARIVEETAAGKRRYEEVSMARVRVQNGQELLAVNDFFIGQRGHASARYIIKYGGVKEPQSSSGVIVSTGLGSTGWMKSIIAGANRISTSVIGKPYGAAMESEELSVEDADYRKPIRRKAKETAMSLKRDEEMIMEEPVCDESSDVPIMTMTVMAEPSAEMMDAKVMELSMPAARPAKIRAKKTLGPSELSAVVGKWSSRELLFAVREPFPSKITGTNMVFGAIAAGETLRIESLMGENGVIFSDGIESDFIAFNSGTEAAISLADKKGCMVAG